MAQTTVRALAHKAGLPLSNYQDTVSNSYPPIVAQGEFVLSSRHCAPIAGAVTVGATAYFVYLGKTSRQVTPVRVLFAVSTGGASTQAGEVGVFSSPTAPNRAGQTLTKIISDATLDDLTGTGVKGNTSVFTATTLIPAGTHIWAGYRVDMASTEPEVYGLTADLSQGAILSKTSAAAFTSTSTYAGALITHALTWQCPALYLTVS